MTTQHVTVRLPVDLVAELRAQAKRNQRSLSFVMAARMGYWAEIEKAIRQESAAPQSKTTQIRAGSQPKPAVTRSVQVEARVCPACGMLNGMHARGCAQNR